MGRVGGEQAATAAAAARGKRRGGRQVLGKMGLLRGAWAESRSTASGGRGAPGVAQLGGMVDRRAARPFAGGGRKKRAKGAGWLLLALFWCKERPAGHDGPRQGLGGGRKEEAAGVGAGGGGKWRPVMMGSGVAASDLD